MPNAYVDESDPQRGGAYWGENGLLVPLQYLIIVTAYSEPAIGNVSMLLCKKDICFVEHVKLNKYSY